MNDLDKTPEQLIVELQNLQHEHNNLKELYDISIAQCKALKENFREQHTFFHLLIDHIPNQIFWKDTNLVYQGCNKTFATIIGLSDPELIVGKNDFDLNRNPIYANEYRSIDRQVIDTGKAIFDLEEKYYNSAGDEGSIITSKIPIVNNCNEKLGILGITIDITERRTAERLLQQKNNEIEVQNEEYKRLNNELSIKNDKLIKVEEKFLKAFKNSPDAILITSIKDGRIIDVNESTSRITGYPLYEIIGHSTIELNIWRNVEDRKRYVTLLNEKERVENFEADLQMKSGEIFNGLFSGEIIQLGSDKYILNVIRDITERKKTEKTLQLAEEKYRFLFERNPASMLIYERYSLKILAVNRAFQVQYGYSSQDLLSMILTDLYPVEEKEAIVELANRLNGQAYVGEWHHIRKDGSLITILVTSNDLIYMGQEARIGVVTDITERKLAEQKIKVNEAQLSQIYKNVFDAIYYLGVESNDLFRFLSVNQMFLNLTGLQIDQIEDKPVHEIIPEPSLSMVVGNYKKAIMEKQTIQWEEISIYPAGKKVGLVTITPLFNTDGICTNLIGTVHDITERKKAEEEIQILNQSLEERVAERTSQLLEVNKELESFSYSISHDLRAPLRAIFGFSQILARRHRAALDTEGQQYMDYIVEASIRMEHLINDLLNYSRLGRKSLNIRPLSLALIVDNIYSDFKQKLEEIEAKFIIHDTLPEIFAEESLLMQVFTNLIENAITYRQINVPLIINIHCKQTINGYILEISDNGIGIAQEYWDKIFNIFQRLHSDDQYPGTGIGLATVRKAISLLNGKVWVESIVGEGSKFFVNLPEHKNKI